MQWYELERKIKKPDIVLRSYWQIWEVENFDKVNIAELVKHAYDYEKSLRLRSFAVTWKAEWVKKELDKKHGGRRIRDWVAQVDPITGALEGPEELYEVCPEPPYDIKFEFAMWRYDIELGAMPPDWHSRVQYELAVWLWRRGATLAFEVDISETGKVYAPDELLVSEADGIVSWRPSGWWPYALDQRPADAKVDVISLAGGTLSGYEVKARADLRSTARSELAEKRFIARTSRELSVMVSSGLFNEVYPVLPREEAEATAEEWRSSSDPLARTIGVLSHVGPYNFEVVKEPEWVEAAGRDEFKVRVV